MHGQPSPQITRLLLVRMEPVFTLLRTHIPAQQGSQQGCLMHMSVFTSFRSSCLDMLSQGSYTPQNAAHRSSTQLKYTGRDSGVLAQPF